MTQFIASSLVKVLVGPEDARQEFFIHKDVITSRFKFFISALSDRWEKAEANTVNSYKFNPGMTQSQVTLYLEAVYTDRVAKKNTYHCRNRSLHRLRDGRTNARRANVKSRHLDTL
jgi:hypothetical protein